MVSFTMLDPAPLERALDIHRRAYRLLRWLEQAIDRGFISVAAAHDYTSFAETARLWLERHYHDIPTEARPAQAQLIEFANYFASFAQTSFDLIEQPGQRRYSPAAHCFCPWCSWLVDVPRLQPKRLTKQHKREARRLLARYLAERAFELDRLLEEAEIEALLDDPTVREPVAICVYARELQARMAGSKPGPAVLAVWRMFAWEPTGSPKQGFELSFELITTAHAQVGARLVTR